MKNGMLLSLCILLLSGCVSWPDNLHIQDRIPHEASKGFVEFRCEVTTENVESIPYVFQYHISRIEHNVSYPIHDGCVNSKSTPISDRPGLHLYRVIYPFKAQCSTTKTTQSKIADSMFQGPLYRMIDNAFSKVVWIDEKDFDESKFKLKINQDAIIVYRTKEIEVQIHKDNITPVSLVYKLTKDPTIGPSYYTGQIISAKCKQPEVANYAQLDERTLSLSQRSFDGKFDHVFIKALETAKQLKWEVLYSNQDEGKLTVKKTRFGKEPLVFTVGIYPMDSGKICVDISSDLFWQRWGSINTNISKKLIDAFYQELYKVL